MPPPPAAALPAWPPSGSAPVGYPPAGNAPVGRVPGQPPADLPPFDAFGPGAANMPGPAPNSAAAAGSFGAPAPNSAAPAHNFGAPAPTFGGPAAQPAFAPPPAAPGQPHFAPPPATPATYGQPAGEPEQPTPQIRNGRVLLAVLCAAVLLLVVPLGIVWLVTRSSEPSFDVGSCVRRSGSEAVAADCTDSDAFTVVSKVDAQEKCTDPPGQPYVVVADGGKDSVLCLRPATNN